MSAVLIIFNNIYVYYYSSLPSTHAYKIVFSMCFDLFKFCVLHYPFLHNIYSFFTVIKTIYMTCAPKISQFYLTLHIIYLLSLNVYILTYYIIKYYM
jgi:hypothetical protein